MEIEEKSSQALTCLTRQASSYKKEEKTRQASSVRTLIIFLENL
jgi:hypothetical protein